MVFTWCSVYRCRLIPGNPHHNPQNVGLILSISQSFFTLKTIDVQIRFFTILSSNIRFSIFKWYIRSRDMNKIINMNMQQYHKICTYCILFEAAQGCREWMRWFSLSMSLISTALVLSSCTSSPSNGFLGTLLITTGGGYRFFGGCFLVGKRHNSLCFLWQSKANANWTTRIFKLFSDKFQGKVNNIWSDWENRSDWKTLMYHFFSATCGWYLRGYSKVDEHERPTCFLGGWISEFFFAKNDYFGWKKSWNPAPLGMYVKPCK